MKTVWALGLINGLTRSEQHTLYFSTEGEAEEAAQRWISSPTWTTEVYPVQTKEDNT